jgi:hypothetical protein
MFGKFNNRLKGTFNRFRGKAIASAAVQEERRKAVARAQQEIVNHSTALLNLIQPGATIVVDVQSGSLVLPRNGTPNPVRHDILVITRPTFYDQISAKPGEPKEPEEPKKEKAPEPDKS